MAKKKGKKLSDVTRELLDVKEQAIDLAHIQMDPNNPRLLAKRTYVTGEERIPNRSVQDACIRLLKEDGLGDLKASIGTIGFQKIDRILVRPLKKHPGEYVVVEGNRRIATMKILLDEHEKEEKRLPEHILKSMESINALVYSGDLQEIAWIAQGLRHAKGPKKWGTYEEAKFLDILVIKRKMSPTEVGRALGLSAKAVGKLIRAYHGYTQAEDDEEYGSLVNPDMFSYFHEVVFKKETIKDWLEWDEKKKSFDTLKLRKYLSWITAEEGEKKRIRRAQDAREYLPPLLAKGRRGLLNRFSDGEISLRDAYKEALREEEEEEEEEVDVDVKLKELRRMNEVISSIPTVKAKRERREQFIKILGEIMESIQDQLEVLES